MPQEGDFDFVDGQRFIYREAWDNGSGYVEAAGWHPYPVSPQEIMDGIIEAQFQEDMEI